MKLTTLENLTEKYPKLTTSNIFLICATLLYKVYEYDQWLKNLKNDNQLTGSRLHIPQTNECDHVLVHDRC